MNPLEDTIAAVATASGEGGVAIVRVSGPGALPLADRLFRCTAPPPSQRKAGTFAYGKVVEGTEELDESILLIFRAPRSYTGEDVVEFQCHGGGMSAARILRACFHAGARPADPGEFTRRAFLNGRIDLVQAEAVMDLVRSHSSRAQAAALQQLEGGLSREFNGLYDELILLAAQLEATLDFPEDELPETVIPEIVEGMEAGVEEVRRMLATWNEGHLLRDGALVVLSGKPNAGKSTLLNRLLGHERAIVSDQPGTTRDSIEAEFLLEGIPLRLVDTAGLRESEDFVEREGIARTRKYLEKADLHLHVLDLGESADERTYENFRCLVPGKSILVCNKTDVPRRFVLETWPQVPRVECCLGRGEGVEAIKDAMKRILSGSVDLSARPHAVISERHRLALLDVVREMEPLLGILRSGHAEEYLALALPGLREAIRALGGVTGREYHEELLERVFSGFCIGK